MAPLPLLPTAAPATEPAPLMPPAGRGTISIDTTVAFGLALDAVALPPLEAPCALLLAGRTWRRSCCPCRQRGGLVRSRS